MNYKNFQNKNEYRKKKNLVYLFVGIFITVIWLVLLLIKIITAVKAGEPLSDVWNTIINGIFDNILGILPPIIFFDLLLEYFQQDKIFDEMTEQITGTIMSKPEVIQSFDKRAQKRFLKATIQALVEQDKNESEMAVGAIEPYINDQFDLRKDFTYFLEIRDCDNIEGFDKNKYMLVSESLSYELFYVVTNPISNFARITFFVENTTLDEALREENSNCIMREGLDIDPSDFAVIQNKSQNIAELKNYIEKLFAPQLYVDDEMWFMQDVFVTDNKIDIEFVAPGTKNTISKPISNKFSLYFHIPQLKQHTSLLASITQPTYNPVIRLSYPEEKYNIKNFLFFNKTFGPSAKKVEQGIGSRNIQIKNKWVHPMSGVVFLIEHK